MAAPCLFGVVEGELLIGSALEAERLCFAGSDAEPAVRGGVPALVCAADGLLVCGLAGGASAAGRGLAAVEARGEGHWLSNAARSTTIALIRASPRSVCRAGSTDWYSSRIANTSRVVAGVDDEGGGAAGVGDGGCKVGTHAGTSSRVLGVVIRTDAAVTWPDSHDRTRSE